MYKKTFLFALLITCLSLPGCQSEPEPEISFRPETMKGAPGYFQVGQTEQGQWWFRKPDGSPFFYKGVCAVNRAGTMGGRRAQDGPYAQVVDEKYNYQDNPDTFVQAQFDRLRSWGFNALGAWTTEEFFDRGMPYTEILEFFKEGPMLQLPGQKHGMPDIFDPAWEQAINNKARTLCATKRHSEELVGYFTDNEIGFGRAADINFDLGFTNAGRFGYSLLRSFLGLDPGVPARERAWDFIHDRYADLGQLTAAWGIPIPTEASFQRLNEEQVAIDSEAYLEDAKAFQLLYAEHYFKTAYQTIKRYDSNHLVMGCRFGAPPDSAILQVMKPWVDVVSINNYRPVLYQRIDYVNAQTNLPVLIGEFSWNPDLFKYVPLPDEPEEGFSVKERVFRRGEEVLLRATTHPAMVGYTWYRWVANTSEGARFSYGLVDREDREEMHIGSLQKVHPKIEPLRIKMAAQRDALLESNTGSVVLHLTGMHPSWDHVINLEVKNGEWKQKAFGWQMEGHDAIGSLKPKSAHLHLNVNFKEWYFRGEKALETASGAYDIRLERDGQYLRGRYEGQYEGDPVSGNAEGYFLPELPLEKEAE